MKKVFARRLLKVAQALRESPAPKKFDMSIYVNGCGTPACALGHYAARRDLQKTFKLEPVSDGPIRRLVIGNDDKVTGFDDVEVYNHFGLNTEEARTLFSGDGCDQAQTPVQAAKYIERFVKQKIRDTK